MTSVQRNLICILVLSAVCYLAFFHGLGAYPLWDPDEGRSGVIAGEMVESGNWLTLTQNRAPYYDKPALYFWLVALGMDLFGLSELAVRLPSAAAAALAVGLLYAWGLRFGGWRKGIWAGTVLATSVEFIALGRFGKMDMLFTMFFTAALLHFFYWKQETDGKGSTWPFYLFLALAVLTKGPIGILLPGFIAAIMIAIDGRWDLLTKIRWLRGTAIVILVCGSWYLPAAVRDPEYIKTFLWDHNVLRFFTVEEGIHHSEPFYYFFPVLLGGFLPWSLLLPAVGVRVWSGRREAGAPERLFLVVWTAAVVVFFSLSRNKLGTYILPAFPPLALLTGDTVAARLAGDETRARSAAWVFYGSLAWFVLLLLAFPMAELFLKPLYPEYFGSTPPYGWAASFAVVAALLWLAGKRKWLPSIFCASLLWLTLWFYGDKIHDISRVRSARALARVVNRDAAAGSRVIFIRSESFPFYVSNHAEEVPTPDAVSRRLQEPVPTVALVKEKHIKDLHALSRKNFFVWEAVPSGYAVVANFPRPAAHDLGKPLNP